MANQIRARRFGDQLDNHKLERVGNQLKPLAIKSSFLAPVDKTSFEGQENRILHELTGKSNGLCSSKQNQFQVYQDANEESLLISKDADDSKVDDEQMLVDNMEAYKKHLDSILIDSSDLGSAAFKEDKENVIANRSGEGSMITDHSVQLSFNADHSSILNDSSAYDHSEISLIQHCSEPDVFYEYADSIRLYMLKMERSYMADPNYMNQQVNINARMRSILIDWMVDVADEYKMKDETLFLAVNYIDRFLSKVSIARQDFQLLGTTALFVASKYEEIYPPELKDFVFVTDESYSKAQVLESERLIFTILEFNVSPPTCNYFLEKILLELDLCKEVFCLSKCMPFLKYCPSEIALASVIVALKKFGLIDQIPEEYIKRTLDYEQSLGEAGDVLQLFNDRNTLLEELEALLSCAKAHPQQAIQRKFSTPKYYGVSNL